MKVDRKVAQPQRRKHSEVSVYKEPESETWYYRVKLHGKRFKRSTGHTDKKLALAQAKIIAKQLRQGEDVARDSMVRPGYATVGDVLKVWLAMSSAVTRKNNASALRKWVRSFAAGDAEEVSMTRVSAVELERYLRAWPGSPQGRESTWRQIRAVFAAEPMRWYKQAGLVLPDLEELRAVRGKVKARESVFEGYVPMPAERLKAMDAAAEQWRRSPDLEVRKVWAVYALMRWCGLRNSETTALRWEWLMRGQRGYLWRFERYQDEEGNWLAPKGRPGQVPVRTRLLGQLRFALKTRRTGFVIPRKNKTEAENLSSRKINDFLRPFFPEAGPKDGKAYELRKQYGSEIALRSGIEVASRILRHKDFKTTWNHYHALLNEPAPL